MEWFIDAAKKQGFTTLLLLLLSWFLYGKIEHLEKKWEDCESQKFQTISELVGKSNSTIDRNTNALERNTEVLESIQTYLGLGATVHRRKKITPISSSEVIDN